MNNVTVNQAYLFMMFILNGIFIGILFDIFRILRKSFNTPNIVTYIEDSIFWTISALTVLYTLFVFNNGEIRAYIFIGLFLGIVIYMLFFSKTIIKISVKIIIFVKEIVYKILKIIIYPFACIIKIIQKICIIPIFNAFKHLLQTTNNIKNTQKKKIKFKNRKKLGNKEGK